MTTIKKEIKFDSAIQLVLDTGFGCQGEVSIDLYNNQGDFIKTILHSDFSLGAINLLVDKMSTDEVIVINGKASPIAGKNETLITVKGMEGDRDLLGLSLTDRVFQVFVRRIK